MPNGIGKNAPQLLFNGDKWNFKGTYEKEQRPTGYFFGQQPTIIRNYVMNHLSGNNGNPLKLIWLLLSTESGFRLSQKFILDSTGMPKDKYYDARNKLIDMNWIEYNEEQDALYLNYDYLWQEALEEISRQR